MPGRPSRSDVARSAGCAEPGSPWSASRPAPASTETASDVLPATGVLSPAARPRRTPGSHGKRPGLGAAGAGSEAGVERGSHSSPPTSTAGGPAGSLTGVWAQPTAPAAGTPRPGNRGQWPPTAPTSGPGSRTTPPVQRGAARRQRQEAPHRQPVRHRHGRHAPGRRARRHHARTAPRGGARAPWPRGRTPYSASRRPAGRVRATRCCCPPRDPASQRPAEQGALDGQPTAIRRLLRSS